MDTGKPNAYDARRELVDNTEFGSFFKAIFCQYTSIVCPGCLCNIIFFTEKLSSDRLTVVSFLHA